MAKNPRTQRDLDLITSYEREIDKYKNLIQAVKINCQHLDWTVDAIFHDVDDIEPYKTCMVCGIVSKTLTLEQKKAVIKEHYEDIEVEISDDRLEALAKKY